MPADYGTPGKLPESGRSRPPDPMPRFTAAPPIAVALTHAINKKVIIFIKRYPIEVPGGKLPDRTRIVES
ncbi:hypothetical protein MTP99_015511 [Tenebrio molitor]|jgi:hypothetical protein|nr:hypothetical protein MTP99_015511 [Tenebrio molitor]